MDILGIIDFWWKPVGFFVILVVLVWMAVRDGIKADRAAKDPENIRAAQKAAYLRAHAYAPCPDERLERYMDDVTFVRRQEKIHDNCEGHAICDLVSNIEYDYRQKKEPNV